MSLWLLHCRLFTTEPPEKPLESTITVLIICVYTYFLSFYWNLRERDGRPTCSICHFIPHVLFLNHSVRYFHQIRLLSLPSSHSLSSFYFISLLPIKQKTKPTWKTIHKQTKPPILCQQILLLVSEF